jgi:hypothetical protein
MARRNSASNLMSPVATAVLVRRVGVLLLAMTLAMGGLPGASAHVPVSPGAPCEPHGTALLFEGAMPAALDPRTGQPLSWPEPASLAGRAILARGLAGASGTPRWLVTSTADEAGTTAVVLDVVAGDRVFEMDFLYRIELAALAVSATGRHTVHIQGNNVATEVTILDAATGDVKRVDLPHHGTLAPYAMAWAYSPAGRCLALSLARTGGPGPETWLIDLDLPAARALGVTSGMVTAWLPGQPD